MTPIIAVFMSMISLLAIIADRASLQEQVSSDLSLSVQGETIPLPNVDDGVSRNFMDVAKRTLPLRMTPSRVITLRRVPRALWAEAPGDGLPPETRRPRREVFDEGLLLRSLLIRALRKRDLQDTTRATTSTASVAPPVTAPPSATTRNPRGSSPRTRPTRPLLPRPGQPRSNSLAVDVLRGDLAVHGRDRDQLRRRWKIEDAKYRVANVRG